jgi:hypothetical protein
LAGIPYFYKSRFYEANKSRQHSHLRSFIDSTQPYHAKLQQQQKMWLWPGSEQFVESEAQVLEINADKFKK